MPEPTLEQRLRRLEDRAAIEDLVTRYFFAADDQDSDTMSEIFAWEAEHAGAYGRDQIVEILREDRGMMGKTIHTTDQVLIEFTSEDTAKGIVGAHWELDRGGKTLYGAARYYDEYVRELGEWRFSKRDIKIIHVGPWEDVATSLTDELSVRWPERDPAPADLLPQANALRN